MEAEQPPVSSFVCPSCGSEAAGKFCGNCGERKLGTEDRSLRHYADLVIDFLTHFDSKGYRSLGLLVARPGFLSLEYARGRRVPYAKPFSLFLSINVIYFISVSLFGANTFTTPLSIQFNGNNYYPAFARRQVERHVQAHQLDPAAFEKQYDQKTNVLSKTLIFLFIPVYAAILYGLFRRHRPYFMDHAVAATHLWAFILLLFALLVPAVGWVVMAWQHAASIPAVVAANDGLFTILLQLCIAVYLALMLRRFYAASWWYAITVAAVVAWAFFQIVWFYRFILFVITLYTA